MARNVFLSVLERMRLRYRFVVFGYVVMPEHFHLLLSEPQKSTPSTVMQAIKLGVARRMLENGNSHHFWQARFYDFNVWTDQKRVEKLRYMHRNPVMRGLVTQPDDWQWSSFRSYALGETGVVRINDWCVWQIKTWGTPGFTARTSESPGAPRFAIFETWETDCTLAIGPRAFSKKCETWATRQS